MRNLIGLLILLSIFGNNLYSQEIEPSDIETEMLELVNRLRANPKAESELMAKAGFAPGHVDMQMFLKEMETEKPSQPLVFNLKLIDAARKHTQYQLKHGQGHTQEPGKDGFTGAGMMDRYREAGYTGRSGGENVFIYCTNPWQGQVAFVIDWKLEASDGGMQDGRGHRRNLLKGSYTEVGIGMASDSNAAVTQNFGSNSRAIGGVAYKDKNKNGRYDAGEGIGGVEISLGGKSVKTWKSGAYVLPAGNGGGKISAKWGSKHLSGVVPSGGDNFKFDFIEDKAQGEQMTYTSIFKIDAEAQEEGLKSYFSSRLDEIKTDGAEMRDAIEFMRKEAISGKDKETANEIYKTLYDFTNEDIAYLEKLIVLKPADAYARLVEIQKIFPRDREIKGKVYEVLKANSNKELAVLLKIDAEADKVLNNPSMKDFVKKSQTTRVLKSYNQFIAKVSSTELRKEAEVKLNKFSEAAK
ncbi:MAG: CAP domain-containing protein [Lentisphaeraceae bacterium]|nr:CAP domain-containing protein [Lentisphaeraceae bacterium]